MSVIESKMTAGIYSTLDQITDDLTLMVDNAFVYFPRQSQQAQDAIALQRVIFNKYTKLKSEGVTSASCKAY